MKIIDTWVISQSNVDTLNNVMTRAHDKGFQPLSEAKLYHNSSSLIYVITMVKYEKNDSNE